jgi:hypothetical protein
VGWHEPAAWTRLLIIRCTLPLTFEKVGTVDIELAAEGIGGPARAAPAMDPIH